MSDQQSKTRWGINVLILFSVTLLCLVITEGLLRLAWKGYNPGSRANPIMVYDDTLGWVGKPNYTGTLDEAGMSVPCRINAWGFRDELPTEAGETPGKRRLMFLGDSFMMGTGLSRENRVSDLIEALDTSLVSFNFGVYAYSTDQELLVLKKYAPSVKPDDVLIFFCANDLIYNDSDLGHRIPKSHFFVDESGALKIGNVPVPRVGEPNPVLQWIRSHLALGQITYRMIALMTYKQAEKRRPSERELGVGSGMNELSDLDSLLLFSASSNVSDLTYHLLRELRDECRRLGTGLTLFTTPSNMAWTTTRNETPEEIQRVLNWCGELGIETVDLFPVFYNHYAERGERLYLPDRMHWNARGNLVAAEAVLAHLRSRENLHDD
jgi:lysophospholipase L1-like esterase